MTLKDRLEGPPLQSVDRLCGGGRPARLVTP